MRILFDAQINVIDILADIVFLILFTIGSITKVHIIYKNSLTFICLASRFYEGGKATLYWKTALYRFITANKAGIEQVSF